MNGWKYKQKNIWIFYDAVEIMKMSVNASMVSCNLSFDLFCTLHLHQLLQDIKSMMPVCVTRRLESWVFQYNIESSKCKWGSEIAMTIVSDCVAVLHF